ncbi:acyl-CoA-binding protein [Mesonia aestuariivivens]|uniref:Acyl-CoA-binding protein n=1 Tax=Mesonia aestuariivivens TaxID=2796128 RepID=A0ABS6W1L1_9FLAO|nr:acyl-CoA-binding protein [Mesonia aestuariivivens]MBW2961748.1 acyl-CoA-binding protein [Mesonia aestuariivivens]
MKKTKKDLNEEFEQAYLRAAKTELRFPPDIRLHFYAYYKRATEDNAIHQEESLNSRLVGAFKMNALFQIKGLTKDQAKQKYIDLVNKYITE